MASSLRTWITLCWLMALHAHAQAQPLAQTPGQTATRTAIQTPAPAEGAAPASCPPPAALPTAETLRAAPPADRDRGPLWALHRNGRTSWLHGTLHVGRADGLGLGPHLAQALRSVRVVALEIDPLDPLMQGQLAAALARPSAARLPRALDDRLKAALRGACPAQAGDEELPADIRLIALVAQAGRQRGLEAVYSSEVLLSLRGRMAGLRVVSLETAAEQAQALRPRTAAELHASVAGALDDLASGATARLLDRTARIWEAGDMDELARYRQWCECARTPAERALLRRLLDERNPRLAARIAALHARGEPVLAAVGALHMVGPTSVPALLKARGFRVERVR